MDVSNRCIADRLRLHEEKQVLLQRLRDAMRTVSRLESQLKVGSGKGIETERIKVVPIIKSE